MKQYDLKETFSLPDGIPKGILLDGNEHATEFTPAVDPDYVFRVELLRDMTGFWMSGERAMLVTGYAGCGKTSLIEQWHARLNLSLLTVVAHPRMEIADLVGHYIPTASGGMAFHYGPVARAALEGISVLIDEYFVLDPGVATGLNALLQGGMLYIPETGEVIRPKEGFRVFAATNPADVGAGFFGRNTQDAANQDRFYTVCVGYPLPEEETPLIQKVLMQQGIEDQAVAQMYAERMVDVAGRVRKLYCGESDDAGAIDMTLSTRSLKRWAALFMMFSQVDRPEIYSLQRAVTNRANPETAKAIHDLVDLVFGTPG